MQQTTAEPEHSPVEDRDDPALTGHCLCGAVTVTVAGVRRFQDHHGDLRGDERRTLADVPLAPYPPD